MTLPIHIHDQTFILHCSGALFWEEQELLLIADVHLGKVTHFRKHGIALPRNSVAGNFEQLTKVADYFGASGIYFLGDLFHSELNSEWLLFENWVRGRTETMVLVEGNHDILARKHYENLGVQVVPEVTIDRFLLIHEPEIREGLYTICGHIHPGIRLHGPGKQLLQLPCFFRQEHQLILPAFGAFTGKFLLTPAENEQVYAITKDLVLLVNKR